MLKSLNTFFRISLAIFLLIISISVISIAGYFGYQKYSDRNISDLKRTHLCIGGDYLCAFVSYKYDNNLKMKVKFHVGPKYISEDLKEDYDRRIEQFKAFFTGGKDLDQKVRNHPDYVRPELFREIEKSENNWVILVFKDKDNFTIKEIKIKMNGSKTQNLNKNLELTGFEFELSESISKKDYKKITNNYSLMWSGPLIDAIKLTE
tara:strand:- start:23 stop:640 length:618 start_codon:yes stop_codon:yes gene_type:complete